MILDDVLINPGIKKKKHEIAAERDGKYAFADQLVIHYEQSLITDLQSGLKDEVINPPAGNEELSNLLEELN